MVRREPHIQSIKGENISFEGENSHFLIFFEHREREGERERERERERKVPFDDSRDFVNRNSSGQEESSSTRRGLRWVSKTRDFTEDSREEFGKSKVSSLGSVHGTSYGFFYAPRGRDSSYFGLFSILEAVWLSFNALKGLFAVLALRGCLEN